MAKLLSLSEVGAVLSQRQYSRFLLGNFLSQSGEWAQRLAVGWLAWEFTGSPLWLGIILFADQAPAILISPIGGAVVDRVERLRLVRLTLVLAMLQPIVIALLFFTGYLNIWILLASALYLGSINAFNQTARMAMAPLLVPARDIARAMPINSISFNLARFAGPAMFGLITLVASVGWAIVLNAISYLLFLYLLRKTQLREENKDGEHRSGHILQETFDGLRYALTFPAIGPLLIVLLVSSLGTRGFMDLLPGFVDTVFGRGPEFLAFITSTLSLGALLGAIYLMLRRSIIGLSWISMTWSMVIGLALALFAFSTHAVLATALLFIIGIGFSVSAIGVMTIIQATVSGAMRGRVLATYGIIFRGGPAVGGLLMGWVAETTGLSWPVAAGGLTCVLAWFWVLKRMEGVNREIERVVLREENPA